MKVRTGTIRIACGVAVSAFAMVSVSRYVRWAEIAAVLAGCNGAAVAAAIALLGVTLGLRALRWFWMLRALGARASYFTVLQGLLVGYAINNVLPLRAGDMVRALALNKEMKTSRATLLGSLVFERLLDLGSLLFIGVVMLALIPNQLPVKHLGTALQIFFAAGLAGIAVFFVLLKPAQRWADRLHMSRTGPARMRDSVGTLVSCAIGFIRETGFTVGVRCGLLSLLIWLVDGSVYACAGKALQIPFTNPGPWFALVLASLSMVLPSAPGYIGTFDISASTGLRMAAVSASSATAFAILVHAILWLPITAAGLICLVRMKLGPSQAAGVWWRSAPVRTEPTEHAEHSESGFHVSRHVSSADI